jgi:hypothetical protein
LPKSGNAASKLSVMNCLRTSITVLSRLPATTAASARNPFTAIQSLEDGVRKASTLIERRISSKVLSSK